MPLNLRRQEIAMTRLTLRPAGRAALVLLATGLGIGGSTIAVRAGKVPAPYIGDGSVLVRAASLAGTPGWDEGSVWATLVPEQAGRRYLLDFTVRLSPRAGTTTFRVDTGASHLAVPLPAAEQHLAVIL